MIIIGESPNGSNRQYNSRPKNRVTAAFLAFFTGWMGGHKFYLGETSKFVLFLVLLFTTFNVFNFPITVFISFFQGLKLLNMSDQEFDRKYNGGYVQRGDSRLERRREEQMRKYETEDQSRPYYRSAPAQEPQRQRANPFKNSGLAKYKEFDLDGAIEDFQKGLDIDPNDVALNFNIACAYSLSEKKDEAYKHLAKAVSLGFNDFERMLTHDDLAFVRIQPEFDSFKQSGYRVYTGAKKPTMADEGQNTKTNASDTSANDPSSDETLLAQLNRLAELRDKGILSEQEFMMEKKKLSRN